jgi:glucose/arabinose dehydrogenase
VITVRRSGAATLARVTAAQPRQPARTSVRALAAAAAALVVLAGCAFGDPEPDRAGEPPRFPTPSAPPTPSGVPASAPPMIATVIARRLRVPWGVAFLPDGGALVTERDTRRILKVGPQSDTRGLRVTPVQTIAEADSRGEGGLLGIAVSPRYETDQTVFIYYTAGRDNRIARLRLGQRPTPIVTGIPVSGIHNGGRLAFGPDGFLYATTGDASQRGLSQQRGSLGGKILRMTTDGKPAPGNPFPDSLVWSYGHRNVQGIAWDEQDNLYATEFGQSSWDEINRIERGRNYGWPQVEGRGGDSRFVEPLVTWRVAESSCSGAAVVERTLVAACLRGQRLWTMELTAQGGIFGRPRPLLVRDYGRLRTAVAAPDGSLWVTTSNHDGRLDPKPDDDRILRLVVPGGGGVGQS